MVLVSEAMAWRDGRGGVPGGVAGKERSSSSSSEDTERDGESGGREEVRWEDGRDRKVESRP